MAGSRRVRVPSWRRAVALSIAVFASAFAAISMAKERATVEDADVGADAAPPLARADTLEVDPGAARGDVVRASEDGRDEPALAGSGSRSSRGATPLAFAPRTVEDLVVARGWTQFLRTFKGLPESPTLAGRRERVESALHRAGDPVVRQNVIFAAALFLPFAETRSWLENLLRGSDPDDVEDALCALAFSGDRAARVRFEALAKTASSAPVHRLMDTAEEHDALASTGTREARDVLRSYRAIEVLDRAPYFKIVPFHVTRNWSGAAAEMLGIAPRETLEPSVRESLLSSWFARYPGHPGSDGIAVRLGRLRVEAGDVAGAARWFARALAGPDQDRAGWSVGPLIALAESVLPEDDLRALGENAALDQPSRSLFAYARVRRLAAGGDLARACAEVERIAAREPASPLGWAWRGRLASPPPKGLNSGLFPLSESDALLRRVEDDEVAPTRRRPDGAPDTPRSEGLWERRWEPAQRLAPDPDPMAIDGVRLCRQLRAWEALCELERRTASAHGVARADLLYKQAAVFYHDRDVLFPCYARHTLSFGGELADAVDVPSGASDGPGAAVDVAEARVIAFGRESFAWERAIAIFESIEREHPEYPAMDRVLFSEAMCWKRLVDYRPRTATTYARRSPGESNREDPRHVAIRGCVTLFERVAREYPRSSLADDSARAAAWWRERWESVLR